MMFGVPSDFDRRRREDHKSFFCPSGHSQSYTGPTEAQKLKNELEEARRVINYKQERINGLHESLTEQKAKTRAEKAAKTRLKNRVTHGVCPCCNRTVKQLAQHMLTEHPEVVNQPQVPDIHNKINKK
jgi:DNA repair exonuclease SbcCD ATPase subunit